MIETKDLIGKPFEMGARGPDSYDCYGICLEVAKRAGVEIEQFGVGIDELKNRSDRINEGKNNYEKIDKPEPFCMVSFKIHPRFVTHMGMVLENCTHFIHIIKRSHVVIERLDLPKWQKRLDGYYKWKKKSN